MALCLYKPSFLIKRERLRIFRSDFLKVLRAEFVSQLKQSWVASIKCRSQSIEEKVDAISTFVTSFTLDRRLPPLPCENRETYKIELPYRALKRAAGKSEHVEAITAKKLSVD